MVIIHHSKDMDGYCSGAICKKKFPEAKLIGWDYKDDIPDFEQFIGQDVLMIDITFPLESLIKLGDITNDLTVIDHHISFKKQVDELIAREGKDINFTYVYEANTAACEIGWKYLFYGEEMPRGVLLIGRYDTWRKDEGDWDNETLPFKYFMYGQCNSAETFPEWVLRKDSPEREDRLIGWAVKDGKSIMKYQETMDEATTRAFSFERELYGFRTICLNIPYFSSETTKSFYNPENHDIMMGFNYTGRNWVVSLRSAKDDIDVSLIAKARGGGGHKGAAGFTVENFEDIFK